MKTLLQEMAALVFPVFDVVTGDIGENCVSGQLDEFLVAGKVCFSCGVPLSGRLVRVKAGHSCHRCLAEPPAYDLHRALFRYEGVVRDLIHRFKYDAHFWVRQLMSGFMPRLQEHFVGIDGIIPLPLTGKKLCERGYNQSFLIAQMWAKILKKPIWDHVLFRIHDGSSQTKLDRFERQKNLENAFEVRVTNLLKQKKILLVDDVHTTGATLRTASDLLKKNAAATVYATSLAIVP